ncbi:MAG: MSMEG_4193 family putative phosphomutase [Chloroflexi bacterium]|nr:MSMEG_4193 family putative phosphomutase [Chloroflexota bacterium]
MTDLLLIRHGENEYTRKGKLAGWTPDVHLNETGQAQANAVAERLAAAPIKAIYSSPLERAMETALPLAKAKKIEIQPCDDVGEVRYGDWTGKSVKALSRTKLWAVVQKNPSSMEFPGGETLRAVQSRAVDAMEAIARQYPKRAVAVFSHGDVIKLILAHYLGAPLDMFQRILIGTGSISHLRLGSMPMVLKMNEQPLSGRDTPPTRKRKG